MASYHYVKQADHDTGCTECGSTPSVTVFWPSTPYQLCKECLFKQVGELLMIATMMYQCSGCGADIHTSSGEAFCSGCKLECGCGNRLTCQDCSPAECSECERTLECPSCEHCCEDNVDLECNSHYCYETRSEYCDQHAAEGWNEDNANCCDECGDDGRVLCSTCAEGVWPIECNDCGSEIERGDATCHECAAKAKAADQVVSFVGTNGYRVHISE